MLGEKHVSYTFLSLSLLLLDGGGRVSSDGGWSKALAGLMEGKGI